MDKAATCISKAYCAVCDSEYGAEAEDAHAWGEPGYTDNFDGTHTASYICANEATHIKYDEPAEHTYEDGKCVCGALEPCKHVYQSVVDNHDGATHTLKCRDCEFVYNAAEAHSYNNVGRCVCGYQCAHEDKSYTDTGYGDHSIGGLFSAKKCSRFKEVYLHESRAFF